MRDLNKEELVRDYLEFSKESVIWMIRVSEEDIGRVSHTLNLIIDDVDRRSTISKETLSLLENVKERLDDICNQREVSAKEVLTSLTSIGQEETEVIQLVQPLIKALQFQDRLNHILGNYQKLSDFWLSKREKFKNSELSKQDIQDLGLRMFKLTSSNEERQIIRDQIPGLPDDDVDSKEIMF